MVLTALKNLGQWDLSFDNSVVLFNQLCADSNFEHRTWNCFEMDELNSNSWNNIPATHTLHHVEQTGQ